MESNTDSEIVELEDARKRFEQHWGFSNYRPAQKLVIEAALAHDDVLAILATGYGKSACFQLPALMYEGCALVISPLIALMKDQAEDCLDRDIPASFINSHVNSAVQDERIEAWLNGEYKLLYVSPERLGMVGFRNSMLHANINYFVVDEAHCHPAGTQITLATGEIVAIEDVHVGMRVVTWTEKNGLHTQKVTQCQTKTVGKRKLLEVRTPHGNLRLTDDHPLWVKGKGYCAASDIREDDTVLLLKSKVHTTERSLLHFLKETEVDSVEIVEREDNDPVRPDGEDGRIVFALTVEGDHCYFANGLLSHNCASMWGHDFRPDYKRIHEALDLLESHGKRPTVIAVTATATADIETDITSAIGMRSDYVKVIGDPVRTNLTYSIVQPVDTSDWGALYTLIDKFDLAQRHIVYVPTRKMAEKAGSKIEAYIGLPKDSIAVYHGGMQANDRTRVQELFKTGRSPIVVATCAFGMGIDVANIRNVIHMGIPSSVEDYTQQTGRAGRDGKPSSCTLILNDDAERLQQFFLDISNPPTKLYASVWEFLLENAVEQTLKMTVKKMAVAININNRYPWPINESQLGTILNIMVAEKLIRRKYLQARTPIDLVIPKIIRASCDVTRFTPKQRMILSLLKSKTNATETATIFVNITELANSLMLKEDAFAAEIEKLEQRGLLVAGNLYVGKSTEVLLPFAHLADVLPMTTLEEKRRRAMYRLEAMHDYTRSLDLRGFLRSYFMDE